MRKYKIVAITVEPEVWDKLKQKYGKNLLTEIRKLLVNLL